MNKFLSISFFEREQNYCEILRISNFEERQYFNKIIIFIIHYIIIFTFKYLPNEVISNHRHYALNLMVCFLISH